VLWPHRRLSLLQMERTNCSCSAACDGCGDGCMSCVEYYCNVYERATCQFPRTGPIKPNGLTCPFGVCCCFIAPLIAGIVLLATHSNALATYVVLAFPCAWTLLWLVFLCINSCRCHWVPAYPSDRHERVPLPHESARVMCSGRPGCENFGGGERNGMCSVCFADHARGAPFPAARAAGPQNSDDYAILARQ
jgi:hypothetical protein